MSLNELHPDLKYQFHIRNLEELPFEERAEDIIRSMKTDEKFNTNLIPRIYFVYEKEEFEDRVKYVKDFFKYVMNLDLSESQREYVEKTWIKKTEQDIRKTNWLYDKLEREVKKGKFILESSVLRSLPHHQKPPYIYDWKENILGYGIYDGKEELENMKFTKKLIGKGGFSNLYLIKDEDETKYALKLFHKAEDFPLESISGTGSIPRRVANENIMENINKKEEIINEFQKFPKIKAVCPKELEDYIPCPWYIMDFVDGKPAKKLLFGKKPNNDLRKIAMKEYAEILKLLHSKDIVFFDNNWNNAMIDENNNISLVDFDLITEEGEKPPVWAFTPKYGSQNQFNGDNYDERIAEKRDDLEGFSKMIDHLYVGKPFIRNREEYERKSKYPKRRKEKIPDNLGDLVEQILLQPIDSEVSIDEFYSVINSI